MIDKKALKKAVTAVLKQNGFECSVCVQNIDTGAISFSNLHGAKVSWGKEAMTLFVPHETTFRIPYMEMLEVDGVICPCADHLEIMLAGRNLLSIREAQ